MTRQNGNRAASRLPSCCVGLALVLVSGGRPIAQDVTEPTLKAGFIYNVAKFTDWPATAAPPAAPLTLCVVGDPGVSDALAHAVQGRTLGGRDVKVLPGPPLPPAGICHMLYVSGVPLTLAAQLVEGLQDGPVLTISDLAGYTQRGGMARCFFENGQLRFAVHLASARRAGLQLSSRLLAFARLE